MSFTPWKFARTIPPTVAMPEVVPAPVVPAAVNANSSTNSSRATTLAAAFTDLAGTAVYLQSVILSLTKGLGITVDVNSNPDLGRALSAVYQHIPPAISITMYSYLLDAEQGAQQVTQAAGKSSSVVANPYQNLAVSTITKAVEAGLATQVGANASVQYTMPLLLRALKTQATVYSQISAQLESYPASRTYTNAKVSGDFIQASTVDVGDAVNSVLSDHVTAMGNTYTSAFNALAGVSTINQDIVCVVKTLAALGKSELAAAKGVFNFVHSTSVAEGAQDLANGLTSFVFVQLMSDASSMLFSLDRVAQMALVPLATMTNSLASGLSSVRGNTASTLVGVIRQTVDSSRVISGPLQGLLSSNTSVGACGAGLTTAPPASTLAPSPSCSMSGNSGTPSSGMNDLSSLLDWGMNKMNDKLSVALQSFQKLTTRSQSDTCHQVKLLALANNLTTIGSLAGSILNQIPGSGTLSTNFANTQLATIGTILDSTFTGNGTTYTVANGVVTVTPPAVPTITLPAARIFAKSGVTSTLSGISQAL